MICLAQLQLLVLHTVGVRGNRLNLKHFTLDGAKQERATSNGTGATTRPSVSWSQLVACSPGTHVLLHTLYGQTSWDNPSLVNERLAKGQKSFLE